MITIKLKGGLGNQLFQYAAARALAVRHRTDVAFDLSYLLKRDTTSQYTFRDYELGNFKILPIQPPLTDRIAFGLMDIPARNFIKRIVRRAVAGKAYYEKSLLYDSEITVKTSKISYLNGYFQSVKYFSDVEPLIRSELQFINELDTPIAHTIQKTCSVSLHVRRGDYVTRKRSFEFHGACPPEYYLRAARYIAERKSNIHIFVFSNDLTWVKNNLKFPFQVHYVQGNIGKDSFIDMQLMSHCQHHIIANSSFSWWGAWLNASPQKIVIAPERWFANEDAQRQTADIIPESWVKLSHVEDIIL